jgi:hypothetical protein
MRAATPSTPLAEQNDGFRRGTLDLKGKRVHTDGIEVLGAKVVHEIWASVRAFDAFTPDNDPHGEHDFGSFDHPVAGKVLWKVDYYDQGFEYGSEAPEDPTKTCRVLTVMLAGEY